MRKLVLCCIMLGLFSGCVRHTHTVGVWYFTPPHNTATTLYGVGEGADYPAAKTMALSNIAHNVRMTLQSRYEKRDQSVRVDGTERTLQEVSHRISTQAEALHFSDVTIEREAVVNGRVYLLVSVERKQLYRDQESALREKLQTYQRQFEQLQTQSNLVQFVLLKHIADRLPELKKRLELLRVLDDQQDVSWYRTWIHQYEKRYEVRRHALHLSMRADASSQGFQEVLKRQLLSLGVNVNQAGRDGEIVVRSHSKREQLLGYYMEKCFLHIGVIDADRTPLASREYVLVGKSSIDFSQSHHNCVEKFTSKVVSTGIFNSLGL